MMAKEEIFNKLIETEGSNISFYDGSDEVIFDPTSIDDLNEDPEGVIFTLMGDNEDGVSYRVTIVMDEKGKIIEFLDLQKC